MTSSLDTYCTVLLFGTNTLEDELSLHYDLHLQVAPVTLPTPEEQSQPRDNYTAPVQSTIVFPGLLQVKIVTKYEFAWKYIWRLSIIQYEYMQHYLTFNMFTFNIISYSIYCK